MMAGVWGFPQLNPPRSGPCFCLRGLNANFTRGRQAFFACGLQPNQGVRTGGVGPFYWPCAARQLVGKACVCVGRAEPDRREWFGPLGETGATVAPRAASSGVPTGKRPAPAGGWVARPGRLLRGGAGRGRMQLESRLQLPAGGLSAGRYGAEGACKDSERTSGGTQRLSERSAAWPPQWNGGRRVQWALVGTGGASSGAAWPAGGLGLELR